MTNVYTSVYCKAEECIHNQSGACNLSHINISYSGECEEWDNGEDSGALQEEAKKVEEEHQKLVGKRVGY